MQIGLPECSTRPPALPCSNKYSTYTLIPSCVHHIEHLTTHHINITHHIHTQFPKGPESVTPHTMATPNNFPGDTIHTSATETAALSSAASALKISDNAAPTKSTSTSTPSSAPAIDSKKMKVDAKDVEWMVKELELSKTKATELLREAGGERTKAVRSFVVGGVGA